ncbi:hypothetical protein ACIQWR_37795 [Streptomyces sp. NPDC098789]
MTCGDAERAAQESQTRERLSEAESRCPDHFLDASAPELPVVEVEELF